MGGEGEIRSPATGSGVGPNPAQLADMDAAKAVKHLESVEALPDLPRLTFPGPVAQAFFEDDADICAIQGPVGSGKTTTKFRKLLRRAIMQPRSVLDGIRYYKVVSVRQTYRELWSTTIPSYLEVFPKKMGVFLGGRGDPASHVIEFEDEFGPIHFIAEFMAFGDNPEASMRGFQTTDLDMNEADTMPVQVLTTGMTRISRYPQPSHFEGYPAELLPPGQVNADLNAPEEDNWAFSVFNDPKKREEIQEAIRLAAEETAREQGRDPKALRPPRISFHRQPGGREADAENLANLRPGYYAAQVAAMKIAGSDDQITRLVDNRSSFKRLGEPVFKDEWNPRLHVADAPIKPKPGLGLLIGLDQGYKAAATIWQFEEPFHWIGLGELHIPDRNLQAEVFGRMLAEKLDQEFPDCFIAEIWSDQAGETGSAQAKEGRTWNKAIGAELGVTVRPQRKGNNRIAPRLAAIRAPLTFLHNGRPGLLLDPRMRFMRAGLEGRYIWTEEITKDGNKRKVPDKTQTEANVVDSGGYVFLSRHDEAKRRGGWQPHEAARARQEDRRRADRGGDGGLKTGWSVTEPYGRGGEL